MKKIIYITAGLAIIIIGGLFLFFNSGYNNPGAEEINFSQQVAEKEAVLVIDDGTQDLKNFNVKFSGEKTAFELLKKQAEQSGIILKTKTYEQGLFIEAIGGKENGEGGKYWLYYVNGQMPQVSADKQKINSGDKIEFKFEKSPY